MDGTRKERFLPGALSWQVVEFEKLQAQAAKAIGKAVDEVLSGRARAPEYVPLLVGHSYDRIASGYAISGSLAR